jgi:hypothetical protein
MGREAKARELRRQRKADRKEMEDVILGARMVAGDEVLAVSQYLSKRTGVPVEKCIEEVRAWLQPHLVPSSSVSSVDSSPSGGGSSHEPSSSPPSGSTP